LPDNTIHNRRIIQEIHRRIARFDGVSALPFLI
jgi:hypothetical protein